MMSDENLEAFNKLVGVVEILLGAFIFFYFSLSVIDLMKMIGCYIAIVALAGFVLTSLKFSTEKKAVHATPFVLWFYYWSYIEDNFFIGFWFIIFLFFIGLVYKLFSVLIAGRA